MVGLLAFLAAAAAVESPTHLTCELGTGAHRSLFAVVLDEKSSTAAITIGPKQAKTGPAVFGPHYITIVRVIGTETETTTISRADLSARQTATILNTVQFGSCKPDTMFGS